MTKGGQILVAVLVLRKLLSFLGGGQIFDMTLLHTYIHMLFSYIHYHMMRIYKHFH